MEYFQKFSKDMFKKNVNITLDLGVAMNVYKLLWDHFQQFSNVVTHVGELFKRTFEDNIFTV